ncbi:MAG: ATP-binding protein [Candidatus Micrarchaeota archaeon]
MDFIKEAVKQNEQWETNKISMPRVDEPIVVREVFAASENSVKTKFITVLRGLRRTGKSVLARKLMEKIIQHNSPSSVAWFEFDRAMKATADDLDSLISFFQSKGAKIIVLDEIPLVKGWQDVLKRFYDRTNLKFIVTGSSALEIDKNSAESLAGRFNTIFVKPFSFKEYLKRIGKQQPSTRLDSAKREGEMQIECDGYIHTGGLPEVIPMKNAEDRRRYVNNSLLDPLFYKDLPALFPEAKPDMLQKMLELLSTTVCSTFQFQTLAQILGCSHPTAAFHLEVLERALLVRIAYNKTASLVKQKRTAKKIVFSDNGVLFALRPETAIGTLAENAASSNIENISFWRDAEGREIDFLIPKRQLAVEVKYQEHITTADEKHLRYFLERNPGWKGVLITKNSEEKSDISHIQLWKWLLSSEFSEYTQPTKFFRFCFSGFISIG